MRKYMNSTTYTRDTNWGSMALKPTSQDHVYIESNEITINGVLYRLTAHLYRHAKDQKWYPYAEDDTSAMRNSASLTRITMNLGQIRLPNGAATPAALHMARYIIVPTLIDMVSAVEFKPCLTQAEREYLNNEIMRYDEKVEEARTKFHKLLGERQDLRCREAEINRR